jgi:prepilin-type N-terminal cleavage/methylation domain-containing protein
MKIFKPASGFTLVEILVVIALIGVIVTALLFTLNPLEQLRKSNDGKRKSDLAQIQRGLELYYNDNGSYPASSGTFTIMNGAISVPWGSAWTPYISILPKDPTSSRSYVYFSNSGQSYYLYASLERGTKDLQVCTGGNCSGFSSGISGFPTTAACGTACNFGLSSPNVAP